MLYNAARYARAIGQLPIGSARPTLVSPRTSLWPMPSVLIHRCCPLVSAMKKPSSTSSCSVKCSWSWPHSSSSAISEFQMMALV
jgi:hypothetical protein